MEISGDYLIPAGREQVWKDLNDPEVLKACIPGCEALDRVEENRFEARLFAKVGPVQAKFKGNVTLQNLQPPAAYEIDFEGSGGVAGFARGRATVTLAEEGGQTRMSYVANANVGGKLAQIGQRLVDSSARKMADDFFGEFCRRAAATAPAEPAMAEAPSPEMETATATTTAPAAQAAPAGGLPRWLLVAAALAAAAVLAWLLR